MSASGVDPRRVEQADVYKAGRLAAHLVRQEGGTEFAYRPDSELLRVASGAYRDVIGAEPEVEVSQCSLELGIFSNEAGRDTISIGTELHDLHNPKETVNHTSVARVWPLVREVMGRLG